MRMFRAFLRLPLYDQWLHLAAAATVACDWFMRSLFPLDDHLILGEWCPQCSDVHPWGERCNRQIERFCVDCQRWVLLDPHFYCIHDRRHTVDMERVREDFWKPAVRRERLSRRYHRRSRRGLRVV